MFRPGAYRVFWISIFAALIAVGAPTVGHPKYTLPLTDRSREGSVNSILEQTLGEPKLAPQITEWLAHLPAGRPVVLVAPPEHMSAALAVDVISYLAWPRPVVVSTDPERTQFVLLQWRDKYCAAGFCYLHLPAEMPIAKRFGPALAFLVPKPTPE